jgi:hypothetical protein
MLLLSGIKNESVISQQRNGISNEFVQMRIAQFERWLRPRRGLLLTQDVGDIIGAKSACGGCLLDGRRYRFGSILADQL